jgi:branched-chain amino acid aminotransferase
LNAADVKVHETVLTYTDFETADEIFMSGNMNKVTAVTAFEDFRFQIGPITKKVRELYWDWAMS